MAAIERVSELDKKHSKSGPGTRDKLILNLGIWSIIASEKTLSIDKARTRWGEVHFRKSRCSLSAINEWRLGRLPDNTYRDRICPSERVWHLYCLSWQPDTPWHRRDQVSRNIGLLSLESLSKQWSLSSFSIQPLAIDCSTSCCAHSCDEGWEIQFAWFVMTKYCCRFSSFLSS